MNGVTNVIRNSSTRDMSFWHQTGATRDRWYVAGLVNATALITGAPATGTLYAMPFFVPTPITLDRIGFNVTTTAAGNARVGIYTNTSDADLYPASLVLDGGDQDVSSGTTKITNVTQALNGNTLYWFVYICGTNAPTIRTIATGGCAAILGLSNALGTNPGVGWSVAQAYGTLPGSYPAGGAALAATVPAICCRIA